MIFKNEHSKTIYEVACQSQATVLITGPTGSGKTFLAKKIHEASQRSHRPFVTVNLATLHEGTLESELFGHERGAFTGAEQRRVGRLELAQGGTLFLDEIGEMPPRLQARLLDVLQSKTIVPVGGNRETALDIRIITATHKDLEAGVSRKEFREDLFHRLRVLEIDLKPLSEREDEFDQIVHECLEGICKEKSRVVMGISEDLALALEGYHWPGNLRELRNTLEYAVLVSQQNVLTLKDLPPWFGRAPRTVEYGALGVAQVPLTLDFEATLVRFERDYLERALRRYQWRVNRTARAIGLTKSTLIRRMKTHGLSSFSFQTTPLS